MIQELKIGKIGIEIDRNIGYSKVYFYGVGFLYFPSLKSKLTTLCTSTTSLLRRFDGIYNSSLRKLL